MLAPWGRFSYLSLSFGVSSTPEVFPQFIQEILTRISQVKSFIDNTLLHAETKEKLREITRRVLKRVSTAGMKMNRDKDMFYPKMV